MRLQRFNIYHYALPLRQPAFIRRRYGYLIEIADDKGVCGWGEVAPLPGFSKERHSLALHQLLFLKDRLVYHDVPDDSGKLPQDFEAWLGRKISPSVTCGLEMAMLDMLRRRRGASLRQLLAKNATNDVPVNGLASSTDADLCRKAQEFVQRGGACLKVKVAIQPLHDEIVVVRQLSKIMEGKATLRLDANRRLDPASALSFCEALSYEGVIEYIEEPVAERQELQDLIAAGHLPIALDETIQEDPDLDLRTLPGIRAVVLKPMLIGGFERTKRLARQAQDLGVMAVVSSSFESGLGIIALANLAAALNPGKIPAGLDTFSFFREDVLNAPIELRQGAIPLEDLDRAIVDLSKRCVRKIC